MLTLTESERDKFILYLKQDVSANKGLIDMMYKLPGNDKVTQVYKNKVVAYDIVIHDLEKLVDILL